jgi:hypothetical protein
MAGATASFGGGCAHTWTVLFARAELEAHAAAIVEGRSRRAVRPVLAPAAGVDERERDVAYWLVRLNSNLIV